MTKTAAEVLALWPGGVAGEFASTETVEERGTPECPDRAIYNPAVPELEAYPILREKLGAGVVICPGGGYRACVIDKEGREIARCFNRLGLGAFVLKYRMPLAGYDEGLPLPMRDARRAMQLARFCAERFGIDRHRLGIVGFSAGGHLAASVSTRCDEGCPGTPDPVERESARPDFSILLYPVIKMDGPYAHQGSATQLLGENGSLSRATEYSCDLCVTAQTPPTFLALAADDELVPPENGLAYYLALRRAGVPAELHIYAQGGHGFAIKESAMPAASWPNRCVEWLRLRGVIE